MKAENGPSRLNMQVGPELRYCSNGAYLQGDLQAHTIPG